MKRITRGMPVVEDSVQSRISSGGSGFTSYLLQLLLNKVVPEHEPASVVRRGHVEELLEEIFELLGVPGLRLRGAPHDNHAVFLLYFVRFTFSYDKQ